MSSLRCRSIDRPCATVSFYGKNRDKNKFFASSCSRVNVTTFFLHIRRMNRYHYTRRSGFHPMSHRISQLPITPLFIFPSAKWNELRLVSRFILPLVIKKFPNLVYVYHSKRVSIPPSTERGKSEHLGRRTIEAAELFGELVFDWHQVRRGRRVSGASLMRRTRLI